MAGGNQLTQLRRIIPHGKPAVSDWLLSAVPDWLADAVRPQPAPVPWAEMVRSTLASVLPLVVGFGLGMPEPGTLVALGGMLSIVVDTGGPIRQRMRRVGGAAAGGAVGLFLGSVLYGHGWTAVIALVAVAGVSAPLSAISSIGSLAALELLVYTAVSLGPLGAVRPWWHTALGFILGAAWALLLTVPGYLLSRRAVERRGVAAIYRALASQLRAIGTPRIGDARRDVTAMFNGASDVLLTRRSTTAGRSPRLSHLMALLNQANLIAEAVTALSIEGTRPPPEIIATLDAVADAIEAQAPPPEVPRLPGSTPGMRALRDELDGVARIRSGMLAYGDTLISPRPPLDERLSAVADRMTSRSTVTFAARLMASVGAAGVITAVLPMQRSYWVILTVVIVLKPDFGSVFARALQRGIGTVVGAVLGAVILAVVPYGLWLLLPFGVLAALLPYGRLRNYGLLSTFLTPLVVLLIDVLTPSGWRLALDRLLDTVLGCVIVLLIGYAPWPSSWQAHLPRRFAAAVYQVCWYLETALQVTAAPGQRQGRRAGTSLARRETYRVLSDLRTEFDRTMAEPTAVSRRAAAWWPAVVGLEEVVDAITGAAVAIKQGAPAPDPGAVRQLQAALEAVADAVKAGEPPRPTGLPSDPSLKPVTDAVRAVLAILHSSAASASSGLPAPATACLTRRKSGQAACASGDGLHRHGR